MNIKSNTIGKLRKIRDGHVFSDELVFLKEFIQNTQRSKATQCFIELDSEKITFEDDGCGCRKPESLFTLDLSEWNSTDEGFGIGFWSCLCVSGLTKIIIESMEWKATVDVVNLFENGDLHVDMASNPYRAGFKVTLLTDEMVNNEDTVKNYIMTNTQYIDDIDFHFNHMQLPKKDLFDLTERGIYESYRVSTPYFEGALYPSREYRGRIEVYYEKRKVMTMKYEFPYVGGVIEIKNKKVQLREPDRTDFIHNQKYRYFCKKMNECICSMYKAHIKKYGESIFEEMDDAIINYLSTKDYERYLKLDFITAKSEKEEGPEFKQDAADLIIVSANDESEEESSEINNNKMMAAAINRKLFAAPDITVQNPMHSSAETKRPAITGTSGYEYNDFSANAKIVKRSFWVRSSEMVTYQDEIAKARYCGINVIISKNRLYEVVLESKNILHISSLTEHLMERFHQKDIYLKNNKEENFIRLLEPIRKKFNLPENCFLLCNLEKETAIIVNNNVIWKETIRNKKDDIKIYGCCNSRNIYLDRRALGLHQWNIKSTVGINELKVLMNCMDTIAHELAHYLYDTTDNTVNHFTAEIQLRKQIVELYL